MSDSIESQFCESTDIAEELEAKSRHDFNAKFNEVKLTDLNSRRTLRYWVSGAIFIIMLAQLFLLHRFLKMAFEKDIIQHMQWLFTTFFGGLFAEIYFLAKLIVQWLFKDIPYKSDS